MEQRIKKIVEGKPTNLKELNLNSSRIEEIGGLENLTNLGRLYLSNNPIKQIKKRDYEFLKDNSVGIDGIYIDSLKKTA